MTPSITSYSNRQDQDLGLVLMPHQSIVDNSPATGQRGQDALTPCLNDRTCAASGFGKRRRLKLTH